MDTRGSPIHTQQRLLKYGPYTSYDVEGNVRDPSCRTQDMNRSSGISHADPMNLGNPTPTHSPASVEGSASNLISPETPCLPRYVGDQKMGLPDLGTSPPRPLSPASSSLSSTMASPFQFPFPDNPMPSNESNFDFQRRSLRLVGRESSCTVGRTIPPELPLRIALRTPQVYNLSGAYHPSTMLRSPAWIARTVKQRHMIIIIAAFHEEQ